MRAADQKGEHPMLLAGIDIGSNAVRLLLSTVSEEDGHTVASKESLIRVPVRLGEDVFGVGAISPVKTEKLIDTIKGFQSLMKVYEPKQCLACATAAMREASNRVEVVERVRRETGMEIHVIDGLEEARILATVNNIPLAKTHRYKMYIDVGGGSTEITIAQGEQTVQADSFRIGTIRLRDNHVDEGEWLRMKQWLRPWKNDSGRIHPVGSGGNINKIIKIYGKTDLSLLRYGELQQAHRQLSRMSLNDRISKFGMHPDRADVIVPAAEIFIKAMKWSGVDFIHVPKRGLSDGIVHLLYRKITAAAS
jgi:exopolyphosphatase/guanosine-5'-triphosphate,3'-diphosphate pyrophosphatase